MPHYESSSHSLSTSGKSCYTMIPQETFETNWTIKDFTQCDVPFLDSATFYMSMGSNISFRIFHRVTLGKSIATIETIISVCDSSNKLYGSLKLEILRSKQSAISYIFSDGQYLEHAQCFGSPMRMNRDELLNEANGFLTNNVLQLRFLLTIKEIISCRDQINVPNSKFLPNISTLFSDAKHSDVKIIVKDEEFACHKAILAVRSPVFAAMLEHDMEEARQNRIVITDFEPEVIKELLRFIYTDQVQGLKAMAIHLLPAADKYGIDRLKVMCEQSLQTYLAVENAVETLVLADMHRAAQLKRQCIVFIGKNKEILETEHWKKLREERRDLADECAAAFGRGH